MPQPLEVHADGKEGIKKHPKPQALNKNLSPEMSQQLECLSLTS